MSQANTLLKQRITERTLALASLTHNADHRFVVDGFTKVEQDSFSCLRRQQSKTVAQNIAWIMLRFEDIGHRLLL